MKKEIVTLFLMASVWAAQAQGTFTIEGQVKNVEDGTLVTLFRLDGNVGNSIGVDTIRNGHFRFQAETLGNETEIVDMMGRSDKFPSMSLRLWVRSGDNIQISGENTLIRTWDVKSTVLEQVANQAFINDSRELWNEYQRNALLQRAYRRKYAGSAVDEERQAIRAQADSLQKVEDEISIRIDANTIKRMKQIPVDDIWLEHLKRLAMSAKYTENYPYKDEVIALYEGLTDEEKQTSWAMDTYTYLFPPQVVEVGDEMADADLYDLEGNVHHLSDFKGKYIMLDFWSRGCGPCIMALPEMKEVAEMYKDRLTIVSLSIDTRKGWEAASKAHEMTWQNLSDLKGSNGLYAKYGVRGIPNYVLISPEGRIVEKWFGYGKQSLKRKLRRLLNANEYVMSLGEENGHKVVNFPTVKKSNNDIPEIRQVVLTDTATVLRIRAYYIPKYWIQIMKNIQLVADNGTVCPVLRSEGIPLGEKFYMPESGETDYTLYFAPLPEGTRSFDMVEPGDSNSDRVEGIALTLE